MARTTGPLFSLDASGSIGKALTYSRWKGRSYVRRLVIPSNPKSGAQVGRRAMMSFLSQAWADLTAGEQSSWDTLGEEITASGFNAYVKFNLQLWHNFLTPTQDAGHLEANSPSDNALTAAAWEENRVKLSIAGTTLLQAWGILIFGKLGAAITPSVGTTVLVRPDTTIAAHVEYWTPHEGTIGQQWTFDTITFSDDGVQVAAGGPQST